LISSACLVSLSKIIFLNGVRIFSRSSKLHIWKTKTCFLQMVPNCENWWGGLYATMKHSTTKCWTCENLLWIVAQINKLFIS
jgi:hypothetical protein